MNVWVTRDEPADGPLSTALRKVGLTVVLEPVVERRVITDAAEELSALGPDDWLVLTSPFAVRAVAGARFAGARLESRSSTPARVPRTAVVGDASRGAAEECGLRVELVSKGGTAHDLFRELQERVSSGKVCYPRSSLASPPEPWDAVEVLSPVLYETVPRTFDGSVVKRVEVVAVASPSAVDAIGPLDLPFASIGPSTSAALRRIGCEPWVEAPARSFKSLAAAIAAQ